MSSFMERLEGMADRASVGITADGRSLSSGYLHPRLWEALRLELQTRYRRATGETMAVIAIENNPTEGKADA